MGWRVLHDDGGGITARSLEYFHRHIHRLGRVLEVNLNRDALFGMEIRGTEGIMLLSGCSCGYNGEGPRGSIEVLRALGVDDAESRVFSARHIRFDLRDGRRPRPLVPPPQGGPAKGDPRSSWEGSRNG